MGDFASLYFLNRHTFVCGTLFRRIKLNQIYLPKQSCTYKSAILAELGDIEKPSRAMEVTLGSSTDTNLSHNHTKI